jgi:hypothetical protein
MVGQSLDRRKPKRAEYAENEVPPSNLRDILQRE